MMAMSRTFAKPKQLCKFWKYCISFKRSECDDLVMETKSCWKYIDIEKEKVKENEKEKTDKTKS
jgi:hypothetical protein